MQCTKEKYLIYFYNQTCGSLIDLSKIKKNTYNREEESITHETQKNTLGKPQLKTPLSVLSYKWKYLRITQSFSSQAIQISVQSLTAAQRHNRQQICLPSVLQASYFLSQFLLGPPAATCVIITSHTALTS